MHYIQRKILIKLLYASVLTYSQLRPDGVESNHFAYHLEQLIKEGLVTKKNKQYFLAPQGLALVDRMSQAKMVNRIQPHILTVIGITNDAGKTPVFKRGFQPYIGKVGYPLGKTHLGETVQAAAERELQEKTGLTEIPLIHRGIVYVHVEQSGVAITDTLCHVFSGMVRGEPALFAPPERGTSMWVDLTDLSADELMPGFLDIHALLSANKPNLFFAELFYTL